MKYIRWFTEVCSQTREIIIPIMHNPPVTVELQGTENLVRTH
jgi:hypothetical protein